MMSCILVLYILLPGLTGPTAPRAAADVPTFEAAASSDPDALYAKRDQLDAAIAAEQAWAARLAANPDDFESAWKLARARYWLGGHAAQDARRDYLEAGIEAAKRATMLQPQRPEGHFWAAANMGALAESFGLRQGLKYRGDIKRELETVLKLDPGFQEGSADRALGRWYLKVPGLFGGSKDESEAHLRKSLEYAPQSTASHYFLAETLLAMDRTDEARQELQRVLDAPIDPDWAPEDREFKQKAQDRLSKLR
jgi:tetratricopeptide (TPR) repeat protein